MESRKPVHTIILDAGPILKNEPPVSSLLARSESLVTVPSVISEIRDATARSRVETSLLPFLTLRSPQSESLKLATEFARRTGDYEVLSRADLQILALAYELECERNGGDWRLRRVPGQRRVNGSPPTKQGVSEAEITEDQDTPGRPDLASEEASSSTLEHSQEKVSNEVIEDPAESKITITEDPEIERCLEGTHLSDGTLKAPEDQVLPQPNEELETSSEESDSEGWITPSNIKKHQLKDSNASMTPSDEQKLMQVATITTDFAMQNVLLQMNLNLLSPSLHRVRHLKTYILRCHACFQKTKDMSKQFCPKCGKPTLMRVSCSTLENGEFKIHLKKKMQWNTRGDRYSIPKPVSRTANGKAGQGKGGGAGGWGQDLLLAEDQKEYVRAMQGQKKKKEKDLMNEDFMPNILSGDRSRPGGRPRIGAGRNVNSKRRT
ncbi:MAG: Nin1 binding protein [Sclerophora amabilis]|nr:MAG: Nin1 binding protein [Sclerophora amabilis]